MHRRQPCDGLDASTFSIVARCPETGMLGLAVASAIPSVGSLCTYTRAHAGAVTTQARVNPYLALRALDLMAAETPAADALAQLLAEDPAAERRQIGIVDAHGGAAAHTGALCRGWAGHRPLDGASVQGNTLVGEGTLAAMETAYVDSAGAPLAERLLGVLDAGAEAGGDLRGRQSAALQIAWREDYPYVDVRVDDHVEPMAELRRVYGLVRTGLLPYVEMLPRRDDWSDHEDPDAMARLAGAPGERP